MKYCFLYIWISLSCTPLNGLGFWRSVNKSNHPPTPYPHPIHAFKKDVTCLYLDQNLSRERCMYIDILTVFWQWFFFLRFIWAINEGIVQCIFLWISAQYLHTLMNHQGKHFIIEWNQFGIAEKLTDTGFSAIQFCQMMYEHLYFMWKRKKRT